VIYASSCPLLTINWNVKEVEYGTIGAMNIGLAVLWLDSGTRSPPTCIHKKLSECEKWVNFTSLGSFK